MDNYNIKRYLSANLFVESCVNELAVMAYEKESEYSSISVICKQDITQLLLKIFSVINLDGFTFDYGYLDFTSNEDDYDKEYGITITNDGYVNVTPVFFGNGEMKIFQDDLIYIHEDINSKVKIFLDQWNTNMIDFSIGIDE